MIIAWGVYWNDWSIGLRVTWYPNWIKEVSIGLGPLHVMAGNKMRYIPTFAELDRAVRTPAVAEELRKVGLEVKPR